MGDHTQWYRGLEIDSITVHAHVVLIYNLVPTPLPKNCEWPGDEASVHVHMSITIYMHVDAANVEC